MTDHRSHQPTQSQQSWPYPAPPAPRKRVWPWVLGVMVLVVLGLFVGCTALFASAVGSIDTSPGAAGPQVSSPELATPPTAEGGAPTPAATGPATSVGDGTYEVGTDLVAGKYRTPGDADGGMGCSYHVPDSTIFGYSKGPGIFTVKAGQTVTLSGGCTWTKS